MADEKRMTAAELRAEQEERERKAKEDKTRQREEAAKTAEERELAEVQEAADRIKATWYEQVVAASKLDGVRFVALAEVLEFGGRHKSIVDGIVREITSSEFKAVLAGLVKPDARGQIRHLDLQNQVTLDYTGEVSDGKTKGWKLAKGEVFGRSGTNHWLIVRW